MTANANVVERCPNCGTTQAAAGECEACHEAQVRYFCTNHEPGLWLSGPTCPQCEARLAAAPPPARSPSRARPPAPTRDVEALDVRPPRSALWEKLLGSAVVALRTRAEATPERESEPRRGFLMRLALRLVLIAAVLVALLIAALYLLARSLG